MMDKINVAIALVAVFLLVAILLFAWIARTFKAVEPLKEVIQPTLTAPEFRGEIGNGHLELTDDSSRKFLLFGGPYRRKPEGMYGVKMAAEINAPYDVSIPTRDFSTPDMAVFREGLHTAMVALEKEGEIYAGCMGGYGRTGFFLLCLYTLWNHKYHPEIQTEMRDQGARHVLKNMLGEVRARYCPHAVETDAQFEFCVEFIAGELSGKL